MPAGRSDRELPKPLIDQLREAAESPVLAEGVPTVILPRSLFEETIREIVLLTEKLVKCDPSFMAH